MWQSEKRENFKAAWITGWRRHLVLARKKGFAQFFGVPNATLNIRRKSTWSRTLLRVILICAGCLAILLPAWLPNRPQAPLESGTVELIQAGLLAAAAAVIFGASTHAGANRPVCRVLGLGLLAGFTGEIEDFLSEILRWKFPEVWVVGTIVTVALITILRHRWVIAHFCSTLGNHAGSGFMGAALLILYVFNKLFGSGKFWQAALGPAYSPEVPKICRGYLELFGIYLIFIAILGLSISLARRREPS
jgi:predicted membrane protein